MGRKRDAALPRGYHHSPDKKLPSEKMFQFWILDHSDPIFFDDIMMEIRKFDTERTVSNELLGMI